MLELLAANAAFVTRGRDRPKMEELLSSHIFIKHRSMIRKNGVARHGWFYDIGADQEPKASANHSPWSSPPLPDVAVCRMFFETAVSHATPEDIFFFTDGKSAQARAQLGKLFGAMKRSEEVKIIYKERPENRTTKARLCEGVHAFSAVSQVAVSRAPRLHYTLTTTASDCILMADEATEDTAHRILRSEKQDIWALDSLPPEEEGSPQSIIGFHFEKPILLYEELFHHFGLSTLVLLSGGTGNPQIAALRLGIKSITLARNQAHIDLLKSRLLEYLVQLSEKQTLEDLPGHPPNPFYVSRASLIEDLGLE